jgi:hypothetical protein
VPEGEDEGADGELQYVDVAQDLDQSPEGPKANLADEGKPRIINPSFQNYAITVPMFVHLKSYSSLARIGSYVGIIRSL